MTFPRTRAEQVFRRITGWRWPILIACIALIAGTGAFLPQLTKDTSSEAFIDPANPALIYNEQVKEIFGLNDPIVTAVIAQDADGVFDADTLFLVRWLTNQIKRLDNIDPDKVTSLATGKHIVGTRDGMIVEQFFTDDGEHFRAPADSDGRAREIAAAIADFPLYQGSLVADDGTATIIVAELIDEKDAEATYNAVIALLGDAPIPDGIDVHVAGQGAVSGYLASYIDQDARRLNPLVGVVITIILVIAFVSLRAMVLPNIIVIGTAAGTFGLMAAFGVDFYVITNRLIAILIGIAVADSIHVFSAYFEALRDRPETSKRELVVRAMAEMWRPITLTTVTTIAGFLALAVSADMPPIRFFGLFGALGVAIAWLLSVTLLPAAMTLWPRQHLPRPFRRPQSGAAASGDTVAYTDWSSRFMIGFGKVVLRWPKTIVGVGVIIAVAGISGAAQIIVNDQTIESFQTSEPIYKADKAINRAMDGTYYLDVMVETAETDGLHVPENLRRIEALQVYLETLPHVNGSTSVVDYIKQMHRAVNENRIETYAVPDDPLLISQLFFLYSASADPTDFESVVDSAYRRALVRAHIDQGAYLNNKILVPVVERYLAQEFNAAGITGTVSGRLNVDYHWVDNIAVNHATSVIITFGAVLLMAMLVFRSVMGGMLAVLPVAMAVLLIYAVLGYGNIWLGVGTSMFAAIAIGLGIDFAIHTLDRLRQITRQEGITDSALLKLFPSTGRALLFNFMAISLGFGVLLMSEVPPLLRFGSLVAVAVATAFLAAMTLVPA